MISFLSIRSLPQSTTREFSTYPSKTDLKIKKHAPKNFQNCYVKSIKSLVDPKRKFQKVPSFRLSSPLLAKYLVLPQKKSFYSIEIKKAAKQITHKHAFHKHASEFGFSHPTQMENHIEKVIRNPTYIKNLRNKHLVFWDNKTQSVVFVDFESSHKGTTFIPKNGLNYFLKDDL